MSKIRVHELAKELKISSTALKKTLTDLGVMVKNHMSIIEEDVANKIRTMFNDQFSANKRDDAKKENLTVATKKTDEKRNSSIKNISKDKPKESKTQATNPKDKKNVAKNPRKDKRVVAKTNPTKVNRNNDKKDTKKKVVPLVSTESIISLLKKKSTAATPDSYYSQENVEVRKQQKEKYQKAKKENQHRRHDGDRNQDSRNKRFKGKPGTGGKPFNKPAGDRPFSPAPASTDLAAKKDLSKKFGKDKKKSKDFDDKSKHLQNKIKSSTKKKNKYNNFHVDLDEAQISKNIKMTLKKNKKVKKYHKEAQQNNVDLDSTIRITEFTSVSELAKIIGVQPAVIVGKFFALGQMVTINQRLDRDSLELMCSEFNLDYEFEDTAGEELIHKTTDEFEDVEEVSRPAIVTVMGHVDHGKTSILDHIRKEHVVAGESGGITQHIGAYQVSWNEKRITFLDTPGHEAFSAMRARGANVTDIAVIVIAATEGIMPQTVEAIDHAKAAGVTLIIAMNKCDLPGANVDKVIAQLLERGVYLEGYGGEVLWTECSAKTGEGITDLLDLILLASEVSEYKAKVEIPGEGIVIESKKDTTTGTVATILLKEGTLEKGDNIICGSTYGKVRKMENEKGREIKIIGPSDVCRLYGLNDVPKAGDVLNVVESEKMAKSISSERQIIKRERENFQNKASLNNIFDRIKDNETSTISLIVKADTDGSVEALCDSFQKLSTDEVKVSVVRKSVGGINEADVSLASASDAIIIGFHVRTNNKAQKLAEAEGVEIKLYKIIYDAIEDLKQAMEGMLTPKIVEKSTGSARVKEVFKIRKIGNIAGCVVEQGYIENSGMARIYRNDVLVYDGKLSSLKHFAEDVKTVKAGTECGIGFENYNDMKEGDVIESFILVEEKKTL